MKRKSRDVWVWRGESCKEGDWLWINNEKRRINSEFSTELWTLHRYWGGRQKPLTKRTYPKRQADPPPCWSNTTRRSETLPRASPESPLTSGNNTNHPHSQNSKPTSHFLRSTLCHPQSFTSAALSSGALAWEGIKPKINKFLPCRVAQTVCHPTHLKWPKCCK